MTQDVQDLLTERGRTHGKYAEQAVITQQTKDLWRKHPGFDKLTPVQRDVLEMVAHKVGRILAGNPNFKDHWDDIAGYSMLASNEINGISK